MIRIGAASDAEAVASVHVRLEDNPRARRFYEAAGWQLDGGRRPIEVLGISVPEVRYRKRL